MTTFTIEASYCTGATGKVEFPDGKTWDDVEDWYVKWDTLYVKFKCDEDWVEFGLNSDNSDGTDWKRPLNVTIYPKNEDGGTDYETVVAEA